MIHVESIESLDGPGLEPYRTMKRPLDHQRRGIFVAEGEKVVRRLLESPLSVDSLLLPPKGLQEFEPSLRRRGEEVRVYLAEKNMLESLTGFTFYQGVLGVGRIPVPTSVDDVLRSSPRPRLLAAVEGLSNATNMGVMVRNCAAFGVQGFILGEGCCSPFLRRAVRNSMGAIFRLPAVEVRSLAETLRRFRMEGIRCVAAHPRAKERRLPEADLSGDCCLVFGGEGFGLSPAILDACDGAVAIPMVSGVDSLNVANAAAIFLYEARRQRGWG